MRWAIATIGLCRWVPQSAYTFKRSDGAFVSLTDVSEGLLKQIVEEDYTQHLLIMCLDAFED